MPVAAGSRCWSARATTAATPCGPGTSCAAVVSRCPRCCSHPDRRRTPKGLAAFRRAGGRIVDEVGDAGPGDRRHRRAVRAWSAAAGAPPHWSSPCRRRSWPWTCRPAIDPDTGEISGPDVRAHTTVTFGCLQARARAWPDCGDVHLVDIGLRPAGPGLRAAGPLTRHRLAGAGTERRQVHPGRHGCGRGQCHLPGRRGAVRRRRRAGDVRAWSGTRVRPPTRSARRWPETVCTGSVDDAGRVQAWVVGPGMGTGQSSAEVLRFVLDAGVPVIADADAITLLASTPSLWDARDPDAAAGADPARPRVRTAGRAGRLGPRRGGTRRRLSGSTPWCCSRGTGPWWRRRTDGRW